MKVKQHTEGVICYVAKLNRSDAALPQALLNAEGTVSSGLCCLDDKMLMN